MLHHALAIPHEQIGSSSARTPDEFAYESEFRALAQEGRIEFRQTATRSADAAWRGARGRIGRAELQSLVHDPATLCFICGPPALVAATSGLVRELGIAESRIQIERWG
jgi:ferredoxin-NADP reductase